jgi:methylated-DNA-[protein]-cysteine S-methyltransferase
LDGLVGGATRRVSRPGREPRTTAIGTWRNYETSGRVSAGMSSIVAFDTALGTCAVRWTDAGIASVRLPSPRTAALARIEEAGDVPDAVCDAIAGIVAVLEGAAVDLGFVDLDQRNIDPWRREVYAAARRIPPGTTVTYGAIARAIGRPDMARDVGAALARNPYPIIVPCHRVLAANGALHGFSAPGGLATKRRMLELEGAPGFGQRRLFD